MKSECKCKINKYRERDRLSRSLRDERSLRLSRSSRRLLLLDELLDDEVDVDVGVGVGVAAAAAAPPAGGSLWSCQHNIRLDYKPKYFNE
jgi:hypothetical protein